MPRCQFGHIIMSVPNICDCRLIHDNDDDAL